MKTPIKKDPAITQDSCNQLSSITSHPLFVVAPVPGLLPDLARPAQPNLALDADQRLVAGPAVFLRIVADQTLWSPPMLDGRLDAPGRLDCAV
jgi:hypothetical protein